MNKEDLKKMIALLMEQPGNEKLLAKLEKELKKLNKTKKQKRVVKHSASTPTKKDEITDKVVADNKPIETYKIRALLSIGDIVSVTEGKTISPSLDDEATNMIETSFYKIKDIRKDEDDNFKDYLCEVLTVQYSGIITHDKQIINNGSECHLRYIGEPGVYINLDEMSVKAPKSMIIKKLTEEEFVKELYNNHHITGGLDLLRKQFSKIDFSSMEDTMDKMFRQMSIFR